MRFAIILLARMHKSGLFQICGLFQSMDWNKCEISVIQHIHKPRSNNDRTQGQDTLYFALISVHGFKGIQEYLQSKTNFTEPGWNHE